MKGLFATLLTAGVLVVLGCETKNTPGGPGAGAVKTKDNPSGVGVTTPESAFRLDVPNLETNIKQGEKKTITIGISRGKNFDQDVSLGFSEPPKGVKITPASGHLKAGAKDVQVSIEADKDAALGKHTVMVTGTPKTGDKATTQFQIEVVKP